MILVVFSNERSEITNILNKIYMKVIKLFIIDFLIYCK
jgi:hypothetical protein